MNKKTRKANHIKKYEDYLKLFPDDKASENERMRSRALKEAQEVRKFEIQLYWHRTAFFWAFITIIYTALFSVLCKYVDSSCKYSFFVPVISTLSGLGIFFSVAWHMVNKGSKFWQKNWESHIDFLETFVSGKIYKTILNTKNQEFNKCPLKTEAFDYSVTIITTVGAIFLTCITAILVLFHSFLVLNDIISLNTDCIYTFLGIGILVIFVVALKKLLKSEGNHDIHRKINKEQNSGKWRQR